MLTGTNLSYAKQYNLRIVLEMIRQFGPISRSEIARGTELSVQTVSNQVKELLAAGVVYETERQQEPQGRGFPSIGLAVNADGGFAIGLDLNRDHLTGLLVDLTGSVRQRVFVEVDFPRPEEALELLVETAEELIARQGLSREQVWGVGVGIPGPMHPAEGGGYVVNPKAFPGWTHVPLARWVGERLGLPVYMENNASAAAIGEHWYGAGRQMQSFFYFHFGSGLGGGLVIDGKPYSGASGNAGEIGYLSTVLAGVPGAHGDSLHVGQHFSLPRLYASLRQEGVAARTPEDLARLLDEGNAHVCAWIDTAGDYLTGLVLCVEYIFDPEAIFLGGRFPDPLLKALLRRVVRHLPARRIVEKVDAPRLLLGAAGVDAAALGIATLPIYAFSAPGLQVLLKHGKSPAAGGVAPRVWPG